ncbi:MAG TPA: nucleotidyltransferase domain-containing protein, partial [Thermomicrobiales bacterium]|nr:nucleotidyltransferase domain-containing protein [Thermomicrobiales bacterium]
MPRDEIERLTPYDDVNAVLAELTDGIVRILDDELLGLYLTGSLTYGGFRRGSSDIDFLVVLGCPLEHDVRTSLEGVHARIASTYPAWSDRVEGSYITADMLDSIEPPVMPRPYINGGAFWEPDPRYGNEWLINLYALR